MDARIEELVGRTIVSIEGGQIGTDRLVFNMADDDTYVMYHSQDCCESVQLAEMDGEFGDLLNATVLEAEEMVGDWDLLGYSHSESHTWTFYKFRTFKGVVTLRWLGESNGYYSERVSFERKGDGELDATY